MEKLCESLRNEYGYAVCFDRLFPDRDSKTAVLTIEEVELLIASLSARVSTHSSGTSPDFAGYRAIIRNIHENARNDKLCDELSKLSAALTANKIAPQQSTEQTTVNTPEPITPPEAELFKSKPIASIKQKLPVSETDKKLLDDWLVANAACVWKWINPDKPVPSGDVAPHCRGESTNAYLLSHNKMDLFDIAKRTFGYSSATWTKLMGNGDLDMLKWLIADGCNLRPRDLFVMAASNNHVHILQYLAKTYGVNDATDVISSGVYSGHLEVLKWALLNGLTSDQIIMIASSKGHPHITMWMKSVGLA